MFIPKDPIFIGVETTSSSYKIAILKKKGKAWTFSLLEEIPRNEEGKVFEKIPAEGTVATALSSREVLVKSLNIPLKGDKEIDAAFEFQVEPLLPYPLDKCIVQYLKTAQREQGTSLTIFSAKKECLSRHINFYKNTFSLEPDVVVCPSLALAALASELTPSEEPFFFIYMGKEEGTCALIEKGKLLSSRSFEKEERDIEKTVLSMASTYKNKKIDSILLISDEKGWEEVLQRVTGKTVLHPAFPHLPLTGENLKKFGLAIGLSLAAARAKFPNFRQKEFKAPFPWKRIKKPLVVNLLLATALFFSLFTLERTYFHKKEEALFNKFALFAPKEEIPKSLEEMEQKLSAFSKNLQESPDLFPLLPLVPKVSDLLNWIIAHPLCAGNGDEPLIKIEDFRYHMISRPDFTKKDETYAVQVDLTFSTDNPSVAEAVRGTLSAPNAFVDSKKDIEWEIGKGNYRAIFFLKDKTRYN